MISNHHNHLLLPALLLLSILNIAQKKRFECRCPKINTRERVLQDIEIPANDW